MCVFVVCEVNRLHEWHPYFDIFRFYIYQPCFCPLIKLLQEPSRGSYLYSLNHPVSVCLKPLKLDF